MPLEAAIQNKYEQLKMTSFKCGPKTQQKMRILL